MFCFNVIVFYCLLFQGFPFGGKAYYPSVILRLAEESNPFRSFADAQDDSKKLSALRVAVSRLPLGGKLSALRTDEGNNLPYPFVILRLAEESNPFRSFADAQDDNETLNFAQDDVMF